MDFYFFQKSNSDFLKYFMNQYQINEKMCESHLLFLLFAGLFVLMKANKFHQSTADDLQKIVIRSDIYTKQ